MRAGKMNHVVRYFSANNFARPCFQCKNLLQFPFTSSFVLCWKTKYDSDAIQRCNGTTAGLGYLEIVWIVHAHFSRLASVLPSTDLNLNHKHKTAAPELTSQVHFKSPPKRINQTKIMYISCVVSRTRTMSYQIKIEKSGLGHKKKKIF
jgi:hypothetical protein